MIGWSAYCVMIWVLGLICAIGAVCMLIDLNVMQRKDETGFQLFLRAAIIALFWPVALLCGIVYGIYLSLKPIWDIFR